jgi:monoamine oxidase
MWHTPITRRAWLASPLALQACQADRAAPRLDGGWLGASHDRGHLLRQGSPEPSATGENKRCAVAIVGGGVAGLAAARALLRAGVEDIALFELEDVAGGNSRAHQMNGVACPQGAHYLPLPGPQATDVSELLHDLGLLRSVMGRTQADERHLCHSPQERLWVDGTWHEGLLPPAQAGSTREAQYRQFSRAVATLSRELAFAVPTRSAVWTPGHTALDATSFAQWLARQGLHDPALRWYLDYACRDDYGADSTAVSAWAGLHYFASRHGFQLPGDDQGAERDAVFTWPEGNAWLTQRMAPALGDRLHCAAVVRRIEVLRHGVQLDVHALNRLDAQGARPSTTQRWTAQHVVVALPLHVAARVISTPPAALADAAARVSHAPWLVANLHLHTPLTDKPGAPPSWDNVIFRPTAAPTPPSDPVDDSSSGALGYVDARHQALRPMAGPTVLTTYWALGHADPQRVKQRRQALLQQPWQSWAQRVMSDLARAHPDLPSKTTRMDISRYGHAMAVPTPGVRASAALQALAQPTTPSRLHMAHSDLAGYSVFEEAYTLGTRAGQAAARQLRQR